MNDNKSLNTQRMNEILKGDTFPTEGENYLDEDIRAFFDELLYKTGQKKARSSRRPISRAHTAISLWRAAGRGSGTTTS